MAKFDYTGLYNTAVRLINAFGAEFTLSRLDTSYVQTYDPALSKNVWVNASGVVSEDPVYTTSVADGVVADFSEEERYDTSIKRGDKKLLTVTIDAPQAQDIYTIGDKNYSYVNHETVQPASTSAPLLYKIQIRV